MRQIKRKEWVKAVLDTVRGIADEEYQKRVWLGKSELVSSPSEEYNTLFDDFLFMDFINSGYIALSPAQRDAALGLAKAMNDYPFPDDADENPESVINDPKWREVRKAARVFLDEWPGEASQRE